MGRHDIRPCPCGSGKDSEWQFDGRGIELCRTCSDCHHEKMSRYNPTILDHYTQEDVDEPIEEEEGVIPDTEYYESDDDFGDY